MFHNFKSISIKARMAGRYMEYRPVESLKKNVEN